MGRKYLNTLPQLEVAVSLKQPKVHTKVMNAPTVVHVTEKVVYAHVTKVIQANHAKHKPFWFNLQEDILNSKQKEMCFTFAEQYIYICIKLISKSDSHYELIIKRVSSWYNSKIYKCVYLF